MDKKAYLNDLLSQMTIDEKIAQLSCTLPLTLIEDEVINEERLKENHPHGVGRMTQFGTGFLRGPKAIAKAYNAIQKYHVENTRLGIPALIQIESIAGVVAKDATVFPVPVAVASTWEPSLSRKIGDISSAEAKALGVRQCLAPVADVTRDARWGRVGETFGEDPTLVTRLSVEQVKGLQKDDIRNNVVSCAKHFLGYGASEKGINTSSIHYGEKEIMETYARPFNAMIKEANLQSVMVTYSEIDGVPISTNKYYLRNILRGAMKFSGTALCDAMSIPRTHQQQGMYKDNHVAAIKAIEAGLDADTPMTTVYTTLKDSIENGEVEEKYLDEAVLRVLTHKYDLGLFENPYVDERRIDEVFYKESSQAVSKEIAEKEVTLLKNDGILPLNKDNKQKLVLVGPFADRLNTLFGGYAYPSFAEMLLNVTYSAKKETSKMEGLGAFFSQLLNIDDVAKEMKLDLNLSYEDNVQNYIKDVYGIDTLYEAMQKVFTNTDISCFKGTDEEIETILEASKESDVIIATLGEVTGFGKDATSGEGIDNPDITLPGNQKFVLQKLCESGKPVVLVLFNGRPLELQYAADHCAAILEVWYPGPHGAQAITKVLSGEINPGGKLPLSFPKHVNQSPLYYGHRASSGYREVNHTIKDKEKIEASNLAPLYHFGHGLSYTTYSYSDLKTPESIQTKDTFDVSFKVKNTGEVAGEEVVQVYAQMLGATSIRPVMELKGFKRIHFNKGEEKEVTFTFDTTQFMYFNEDRDYALEAGTLKVFVGSSSIDLRLETQIEIAGKTYTDEMFVGCCDFTCTVK
ncbi:glycoside hydrolase family 3 N-terminal domain-containing protein [Breznakia pachnodae]|uniref:Beta-glucosidase n=1 Tax=Breznakia pachnodae TaxID=265178 RepID=A0ABU0E8I8_9FIRM|nr:glycoside hydrolase family 3 N-terminal domain-containing protein [Breznakia pachnodae]MDQ0363120.1 beta-glucosidase [Breznakia pachnodae]